MLYGTAFNHAVTTGSTRLGLALALLAAALLADTGPAAAQPKPPPGATRIFVTIEGSRQGKFKAEGGPQFGDRIPILRFEFDADAPRDMASGQASGKRGNRMLTIVKDWSAASPQLFQAVATNEPLKSVFVEYFRTAQTGQEELVATVRLTNATNSKFRSTVPDSTSGDGPAGRLVDRVDFVFQKIEIANPAAKTAAAD
jgi:type VI secretion system secreted protein Hcp